MTNTPREQLRLIRLELIKLIEILKSILLILCKTKALSLSNNQPAAARGVVIHIGWEGLFKGWFNNQMTILLLLIQSPRPRAADRIMRVEFFLHDLEHHFLNAPVPKSVCQAFRYLKRYLKIYPNIHPSHSKRAVEMVGRIYRFLGVDWMFETSDYNNKKKVNFIENLIGSESI